MPVQAQENTTNNTPSVASSADKVSPLDAGDTIPNAVVTNVDAEPVYLHERVTEKPAVLIFYRGGWCPYCSTHLRSLKDIVDPLEARGVELLAISPDPIKKNASASEELDVSYQLLSDADFSAIKAFGLAFRLSEQTVENYRTHDIPLRSPESDGSPSLPVPAVYVVAPGGEIVFRHFEPNYKERLAPQKILQAVEEHL